MLNSLNIAVQGYFPQGSFTTISIGSQGLIDPFLIPPQVRKRGMGYAPPYKKEQQDLDDDEVLLFIKIFMMTR